MLRLSSYGVGSSPASPPPLPVRADSDSAAAGSPAGPSPLPSPPPLASPAILPNVRDGEPQQPAHVLLVQRTHQLRRIAQDLALWFTHLAQLHHAHSLQLAKLDPLLVPFKERSLFIPLHDQDASGDSGATTGAEAEQMGGTGQEGWQDIFRQANATSLRISQHHADLAKRLSAEVVAPLTKLALELKTHLQVLERELKHPVDQLQKERDLAKPLQARLSSAISLVRARAGTSSDSMTPAAAAAAPSSSPWPFGRSSSSASAASAASRKVLPPTEDPVLLRTQLEARLRVQLDREADLAALVQKWTAKTREREMLAFEQIKQAWSVYEQLQSSVLLESQQLGMFLAATVDAVPTDAEWSHFVEKGFTVPDEAPRREIGQLEWDGKSHEVTRVVKEGLLERQTSILKSWKPAYFILTPAGILHIYGPPPSSVTLPDAAPAEAESGAAAGREEEGSDSPHTGDEPQPEAAAEAAALSPTAQYLILHSSPHMSLNLSHCFLGPMPTPSPLPPSPPALSPSAEAGPSASEADLAAPGPSTPGRARPPALDAVFTLIEAVVSGKELTMPSGGTRHVVRCKGENGWEEMGTWVAKIGKFCAVPSAPPPPSPPTPTPPAVATLHSADTDADAEEPTEEQASPAPAARLARAVPPLPERSVPPLPSAAGASPSVSAGGPPPALPPRDSFLSQTSTVSSTSAFGGPSLSSEAGDGEGGEGDLAHAMASFGLGGGAAQAASGGELEAPRGEESIADETQSHEEGGSAETTADEREDDEGSVGGDLGRSHAEMDDAPAASKVRNLAAAWESHGSEPRDGEEAPIGGGGEERGDRRAEEGLPVPKGKKGKKKRKSKGKDAPQSGERPLPTPSDDPESADLGMPSPHSPTFESAPGSPRASSPLPEPDAEAEGGGDQGSRLEEEEQTKPPLVLEEVEEAPDLSPEHEGGDGDGHDQHAGGEHQ